MNEHAIEQHLKKAVEAIGGLCWKFTSPGTAGVPDRICIHRGRVIFVELKAPDASHAPSNAAASSSSKITALMRSSSTTLTRSRRWLMRYEPHDYQRLATAFVEDHPQAAILLGMGLGKTVITLTAIWNLLLDSFQARRVLIVAPCESPAIPGLPRPPSGTTWQGSPLP